MDTIKIELTLKLDSGLGAVIAKLADSGRKETAAAQAEEAPRGQDGEELRNPGDAGSGTADEGGPQPGESPRPDSPEPAQAAAEPSPGVPAAQATQASPADANTMGGKPVPECAMLLIDRTLRRIIGECYREETHSEKYKTLFPQASEQVTRAVLTISEGRCARARHLCPDELSRLETMLNEIKEEGGRVPAPIHPLIDRTLRRIIGECYRKETHTEKYKTLFPQVEGHVKRAVLTISGGKVSSVWNLRQGELSRLEAELNSLAVVDGQVKVTLPF